MRKQVGIVALLVGVGVARQAAAADLTLDFGDVNARRRISVELIGSEAAFSNSISAVVVAGPPFSGNGLDKALIPGTSLELSGCNPSPSAGLPDVYLLAEKKSLPPATPDPTQRGCRVELRFKVGPTTY